MAEKKFKQSGCMEKWSLTQQHGGMVLSDVIYKTVPKP